MVELKFLNKNVSFCQVCTALWNLLKQIGMGHLTKSLITRPTVHFTWHCCTRHNLGEDWGFWTKKCLFAMCAQRQLFENWSKFGWNTWQSPCCLLACPTVHFTWHWVKIEVFEQNCLLAMCAQRQLFEIYWNKLGWDAWQSPCRPPARSLTGVIYFTRHRCTRYNLGVVASCFFSRTDIFTYLYHETLYPALSLAFY